jgi:hypothetical protein
VRGWGLSLVFGVFFAVLILLVMLCSCCKKEVVMIEGPQVWYNYGAKLMLVDLWVYEFLTTAQADSIVTAWNLLPGLEPRKLNLGETLPGSGGQPGSNPLGEEP